MKVIVKSIDDSEYCLKKIMQLSFIQTYGVACDAVLVTFCDENFDSEIYSVRVFNDDKLIFNGYCDNQRRKVDKNGVSHSIYARIGQNVFVSDIYKALYSDDNVLSAEIKCNGLVGDCIYCPSDCYLVSNLSGGYSYE